MDNRNGTIRKSSLEDDILAKYLIFRVNGQHYGISIATVTEIVQMLPVTKLPGFPFYVKGIINLRGRIIPLIDMNLWFGKQEREYTERTCIIIADFSGLYMGLIVDAVEEVRDIDGSIVSPPPSFSADDQARYVTGIGKLDKRLVLLLDGCLLFSDTEINAPLVEQVL